MSRGERSESIPTDLVIEILLRLPAKSIARCRCVSKLWGSMLLSPYFTELYRTKSSPRLWFAVKRFHDWCFLTSPLDEKPSSLAADFHMNFSGPDTGLDFCGYDSGFIHFCRSMNDNNIHVVCNPSTGQYVSLPLEVRRGFGRSFLGFDPINKQFKLLSITIPFGKEEKELTQIFTIGSTGNASSWRKIHCPLDHFPTHSRDEICINGVLYYLAFTSDCVIVCFDVRSEKFKFISRDFNASDTKLINHKGKLGMITLENDYSDGHRCRKLCMSVMKDFENPELEWSKHFSWNDEFFNRYDYSIVGVTATSEIVLSTLYTFEPFYVIYINLERGTIRKVEIQGLKRTHMSHHGRVEVFTNYVENLNCITTMTRTTSTSPPELKRNPVTTSKPPQQNGRTTFESVNKFDYLRLLDDDGYT